VIAIPKYTRNAALSTAYIGNGPLEQRPSWNWSSVRS